MLKKEGKGKKKGEEKNRKKGGMKRGRIPPLKQAGRPRSPKFPKNFPLLRT